MNINNHYEQLNKNKKGKNLTNNFPYIHKITPVRTLLESSSQLYRTIIPNRNNFYINQKKSCSFLKEKNINTKLYKVNDYISMRNQNLNHFSTINILNKTRNKKNIGNFKDKNNRSDIKEETWKKYRDFYRKNSTDNYNISTNSFNNNNINLYNNNQNKNNFNKSSTIFNESINNNQNINNNNDIIKKINEYNLNLLKKSRYFSKTKYINGIKNKIKDNQKHISKSLSTKNISLENTGSSSVQKTFNEIKNQKLFKKQNNIEEYNKNPKEGDTIKKTESKNIGTNTEKTNNAIFYDFIPIILQHMKQKENLDKLNKENENKWLFDKINNLNNSTELTKSSSLKLKNNLFQNPIIKYLFLEKTLYNLRHRVQFIDINKKEEFEEKVLKIMGEEYDKLEDKQSMYNIHDFKTYGFEFDPIFYLNLKQIDRNPLPLIEYLKTNKSIQKDFETKLSTLTYYKNKGEFFTTNKSEFNTDEKKGDNNNESSEKTSLDIGGLFGKVMNKPIKKISYKIRKFEGFKNKKEKNNNKISNINENEDNKNKEKEKEGDNIKKDEVKEEISSFNIEKYKLELLNKNTDISRLGLDLLNEEKNYNTAKEKFNPNKNNLNFEDISHIVNDVQSRDKIKKRHGNKYLKVYSIKKKPKKNKKILKSKSSEKIVEKEEEKEETPKIDDLIKNNATIPNPEEIKKEEPPKEIKNKFDYERYKQSKIKEIELDKESKKRIFDVLKKQDIKRKTTKKRSSLLNEIYSSYNYKKDNSNENNYGKKLERIKKMEEKKKENEEEEDIITQLRKLRQAEKEKEENEEDESLFSSDDDEYLDDLDLSKDMENNGEIMKKKWIENSPKFKNRLMDKKKRRYAISSDSHEMFKEYIKNEKIDSLNEKMKKLYEKLERKKNKKKKRIYSFEGVDLTSLNEIEKKKIIFLNRIKEDIKYKIHEGKYHMIEMDNFKIFEEAMKRFKLKNALDNKKVKIYINLVEKYLHFYQLDLDRKEKEKEDEDRINKFLRNLNQEVYVTLPYIRDAKGRYCHSVDYFKELQELSEYHGFY